MPRPSRLPDRQAVKSLGLSALDRIRDRREPKPWVREAFAPTWDGVVLSFDQALSNTGWAYMQPEFPYVTARGVLHSEAGESSGTEDDLLRAVALEEEIDNLIWTMRHQAGDTRMLIAYEAPPISGSQPGGGRSSLLVALDVLLVAKRHKLPAYMVQAQHAKKRLTGNGNAEKPEVRVSLEEMWPHLKEMDGYWNNDVRDAVLVGLMAFEEAKEKMP